MKLLPSNSIDNISIFANDTEKYVKNTLKRFVKDNLKRQYVW